MMLEFFLLGAHLTARPSLSPQERELSPFPTVYDIFSDVQSIFSFRSCQLKRGKYSFIIEHEPFPHFPARQRYSVVIKIKGDDTVPLGLIRVDLNGRL